jgi:uncharacterized protein YbjT (DUF2867 family)
MGKRQDVLLAGATGLIGKHLLALLLDSEEYNTIHLVTRRAINIQHEKLILHLTDFEQLEEALKELSVTTVFCCMGTTMKSAGSAEVFRKVDYEYPLRLGQLMKKNSARQYVLVSSIGADKNSRLFYSRVKGEIEKAITELGYATTLIFRPSILLGSRQEFRLGETTGKIFMWILSPVLIGPLRRYRPIKAASVAAAMAYHASQRLTGLHIYESEQIQNILNK